MNTTTLNLTTPRKFYDMLKTHDWYFDMSDCFATWSAGNARRQELKAMAEQSPEHQRLYDGFRNHHFSGPAWGTRAVDLPARP